MRTIALIGGPLLAAIVYTLAARAGLDHPARAVAGVGTLMATWWLAEVIPLPATALLPIVLFPLLGVSTAKAAAAPYASDLIYLFLGGFMLGLAMEKSGLHKRIALRTVAIVGVSPRRIVAGFMIASALLSMWVSNTATAIMMLPIGMTVIEIVRAQRTIGDRDDHGADNLGVCLMLGIAYACSIGGVGTLIGTPPNLVLAGFVEDNLGRTLTMAEWMPLGLTIVAVMLPITWLLLTFVLFPVKGDGKAAGEAIAQQRRELPPMARAEWLVFIVFMLAAALWITRPMIVIAAKDALADRDATTLAGGLLTGITMLRDSTVAVAAAIVLFLLPAGDGDRVMDWSTAKRLPWGVLILFGGGLSLAAAMDSTGVSAFLGKQFEALEGVPTPIIVLAVCTLVVFLTELTSNTAVTTTLMPVLAAAAVGLGLDNALILLIPAAVAASCAFMLPVATPPNAIVFGSGSVTIRQMSKAGIWLNLISIVVVAIVTSLISVG